MKTSRGVSDLNKMRKRVLKTGIKKRNICIDVGSCSFELFPVDQDVKRKISAA